MRQMLTQLENPVSTVENLLDRTVGELVVECPGRARVFEGFGIDYCCGGGQPLGQACQARGLDPQVVQRVLEATDQADNAPVATDWSAASMTELCDHIEQTHHAYLKIELPRLGFMTGKVANRHGERDARLVELAKVFTHFRGELESHMMKEERILFPLCRQLESGDGPVSFHCGSVRNPISVMVQEHDDAGGALARMRVLTDGFAPPPDACNTYRALFDSLAQLERDLHQHIHKENNILFPRAAQAEAQRGQ
jgi:regulator of cell morphogenesis and NO signaling